jgi:hypothetical protein
MYFQNQSIDMHLVHNFQLPLMARRAVETMSDIVYETSNFDV